MQNHQETHDHRNLGNAIQEGSEHRKIYPGTRSQETTRGTTIIPGRDQSWEEPPGKRGHVKDTGNGDGFMRTDFTN